MNWKPDKKRPLSSQICEKICADIVCGAIDPGEKLMSVREFASEAGINPNTVQHAFELLEAEGILYSQRGSGWFATEETETCRKKLDQQIRNKTEEFFEEMKTLGLTTEETKDYVKEWQYE